MSPCNGPTLFIVGKWELRLDTKTGLLWKFNEITFDDYREVTGVWFPFAITIKPGAVIYFAQMENNVPIDQVSFDPPKKLEQNLRASN